MKMTIDQTIVSVRGSVAVLVAALVLGACSSPKPSAPAAAVRPDTDRVAAIRTIRGFDSGEDETLQVTPLREPAVEGFLKQAEQAEREQRYDDALQAITRARALAPEAPDLLQVEAEIEFLRGNIVQAEKLAYESFQKGPQLGTLCGRNWQTIVEARKIFNDDAYRVTAEAKRDACKVKRPVRL